MSHWIGYAFLTLVFWVSQGTLPGYLDQSRKKSLKLQELVEALYDKNCWNGNSKEWEVLKCPALLIWVCIRVTLQNCFFPLRVPKNSFPLYFLKTEKAPGDRWQCIFIHFAFIVPVWTFVLQTEISSKYNSPLYFCFLLYFSLHSSCRRDQFTVLILTFGDA